MLLDKWHTKFIGEGGGFAVSRKPHPLSENDGTMNKAIRLILNEEKHLLPIIYVYICIHDKERSVPDESGDSRRCIYGGGACVLRNRNSRNVPDEQQMCA